MSTEWFVWCKSIRYYGKHIIWVLPCYMIVSKWDNVSFSLAAERIKQNHPENLSVPLLMDKVVFLETKVDDSYRWNWYKIQDGKTLTILDRLISQLPFYFYLLGIILIYLNKSWWKSSLWPKTMDFTFIYNQPRYATLAGVMQWADMAPRPSIRVHSKWIKRRKSR